MLICQLTDPHVCAAGTTSNRVSETNMFAARAFRTVAGMTTGAGRGPHHRRPDRERDGRRNTPTSPRCCDSILPMPVYVIPGNHDRRDNFRRDLAHLPGVTARSGVRPVYVDDLPVRLVMLDTLVPGARHGELRDDQLAWLDRTLAAVPDKPTMIGMHHPPFACGIAHWTGSICATRTHSPRWSRAIRRCGGSCAATTTGRSSHRWRTRSRRWRHRSRIRWN